jgi:hypothetical protein
MNVEFHYYTIYYLAQQAGFADDQCRTIAYSSQYLDNALICYEVEHETGVYRTAITHHFGFWDTSQEWDVWIPFHFFPAGSRTAPGRVDGEYNRLDVQPNSDRVKQMLVGALKSRNLYRVGVALHTYADSWAHQNFSGRNEAWNRLDKRSALPPIGHAQAKRDPDGFDSTWKDPRLRPPHNQVDNRERFLAAAGRIYRYLATFNHRKFDDEELVISRLERIMGPAGTPREARIADFVIECGMEEYSRTSWRREAFTPPNGWQNAEEAGELESALDKINWLKDELLHKTKLMRREPVKAKPGFFESDLFYWDQAAQTQRQENLALIEDLR